jgi:signal transduction histidine kinase/DNA-binding response OmpR family regulator
MRITVRAKLLAVAVAAVLGIASMFLGQWLIARHSESQLAGIQHRYLPRVGLRAELGADFERMRRALQDAVAAADADLLEASVAAKQRLISALTEAGAAVDADKALALTRAVEDYHRRATALSRRLIEGETGEGLVVEMEAMQEQQRRVEHLLEETTRFDRAELTQTFAAVLDAQRSDARSRLLVSAVCLVMVIGLALWINRGLLLGLRGLSEGFRRFGSGDLGTPIELRGRDELTDVAEQANQMAESLDRLLWLETASIALGIELRGELTPREVADRASAMLVRTLGAAWGALYSRGADGTLAFTGGYAIPDDAVLTPPEVAADDKSGLSLVPAEGTPDRVRLPLLRVRRVIGVLELTLRAPWSERAGELLAAVRDSISIALEVARARAATAELLEETRRQRSALELANHDLDETRLRLEQKATELEQASAYKSQFLANMSHELRTPLNAIIGFSELLYDGQVSPSAPEAKEFLGDVLTSGRHLLQLINDVLDLTKVEAGKIDFFPEAIEPAALVGEVLAILRTTAATKRVRIEAEIDPALGTLFLDAGRLKQVLYNYCSNALKFTPDGGSVKVRARGDGDETVRIEVEDTGIGISEADLGRLWQEFQQLQRAEVSRVGGTGLGLALTRRLVEAQGGTVGVTSVLGKGSTFWARLPRRVLGEAVPPIPQPTSSPRPGAPAVLVIEDDPADQADLVSALGAAGYVVEVAATGAQALVRWRDRQFDAITLDLLLPDMSGLEVLARIRAASPGRQVPVIVITVVTEPGAVAGFAVKDVLPKPLQAEVLLGALTRAGVAPQSGGAVLVVDDDPGSQRLMAATLRQLGYQPQCEADGVSALEAFHAHPPRAIVLDLSMPRMDGFEFLARLRELPEGRRVPVIVWTVKDLSPEEQRVLRASAQAVVGKGRGAAVSVMAELEAALRPA